MSSKTIQKQLSTAIALHKQGELSKAEAIYRNILALQVDHADALHLLGLIALQKKKYSDAIRLIELAISNKGNVSDYYNNLGTVLKELGRLAEARQAYLKALDLKPLNVDAIYNLGGLCLAEGQKEQAIHYYRRTLSLRKTYYSAYANLSAIYNDMGQFDLALECCQIAVQSGTNDATLFNNMGNALKAQGNLAQAADVFQKAIDLDPTSTQAYCNLGNTLFELGRPLQAIERYHQALATDPNNIQAFNNFGTVLRHLGRFQEALRCYQNAIRLRPQDAIPYHNMGNCFFDLGKNDDAKKCFEKALILDPGLLEAYISLGIVLQDQGRHTQAQVYFQKAISHRPDYAKPYGYLIRSLQHECDWQAIERYGPELDHLTQAALDEGRTPDEGPFLHLIRHADPYTNFLVAKAWSKQFSGDAIQQNRFGPLACVRSKNNSEKITIAYLSNNFRNHPTAHLIAGLFEYHDRARFTILCYSYGKNDQSSYRRRIETNCDRFVEIEKMDHMAVAHQIHLDRVDILVDLVGFMKSNRLEIAAYRPAPIQVRWMGMAGTCGAEFFDYLITDETVTPPDQAAVYAEVFCYMPHTYQINSAIQDEPESSIRRVDVGLPENKFVFCSFCSTYKIDATVFATWLEILHQVPNSVLWLLAPSLEAQEQLWSIATLHKIDPDRIIFAPKMDRQPHLDRLACADLCLDTLIVNGAATTSEALWRGVPVLTVKGKHFASRMAASILTAIDMPELVVDSVRDYVALAVTIGQDQDYLQKLKSKLIAHKHCTPLFDRKRFIRNLENRYAQMWQRHQTDQPKIILGGRDQE